MAASVSSLGCSDCKKVLLGPSVHWENHQMPIYTTQSGWVLEIANTDYALGLDQAGLLTHRYCQSHPRHPGLRRLVGTRGRR
jgi:hypothetical protein